MTCNEIENRLPAYLEDLLSPEEKKSVAEHLASCSRCSRAFADLKKAEALVQDLTEVEPPPFFEQRIMSRVREEARQKQGLLRRLFYPLHIKVPIQALATLVVAVLAFYVYQQGGPEMKQTAPLSPPLAELGKGQVTAESPKPPAAPSAAASAMRTPTGDLSEKDGQRFAAPPFENKGKADRSVESRAPMGEEGSAAMSPSAPIMAAKEKEALPDKMEALSKVQDGIGRQDARGTLESLPQEQKPKGQMADAGAAAEESSKTTSAPAPSRLAAAAAIKRSAIDLTLQVREADAAIREIEARLGQVNARIIERQHLKGSEFLKVEIAERNVAAFLDRLEAIGQVNMGTHPRAVPDEVVTVSITIVSHP